MYGARLYITQRSYEGRMGQPIYQTTTVERGPSNRYHPNCELKYSKEQVNIEVGTYLYNVMGGSKMYQMIYEHTLLLQIVRS